MSDSFTDSQTNLYDLWKFISQDTAKVKDRLWTIASWLYALMSGLIAFAMKNSLSNEFECNKTPIFIIMMLCGIGLSIYTCFMIWQYGMHVRHGWNRTEHIAKQIEGLHEILKNDMIQTSKQLEKIKIRESVHQMDPTKKREMEAIKSQELPKFAWRLFILSVFYGFAFLILLVIL